MRLRFKIALAAFWVALASAALAAERAANWRIFPVGELPTASITFSPRGRVIAKQGDGAAITILDGYTTRPLTLPEPGGLRPYERVYESRSGQFWTTSPEGVWLFQRGQWVRFAIPEVRTEMGRAIRQTRALSLVPAEINRVLILLSDRLLEFDAASGRTTTIKLAADTKLGPFLEMIELSEGGLLISASNGLARVQETLRRLNASTPWKEFLLPAGSPVEGLQRPFEGRDSSALSVGFDRDRSEVRHILSIGNSRLNDEEISGEKIRYAWPGWGDTRWGMGFNALYRFTPNGPTRLVREAGADTYYDVATQTNGVFWLATSAGVIRYAPPLWQEPAQLAAARLSESASFAMTAGENALWLATSDGLVRVGETNAERFAWPDEFENMLLPQTESIFETRHGRVLIGTPHRILTFEPRAKRFEWMPMAPGVSTRALGKMRDGAVALRVSGTNVETRMDRFDGAKFETVVTNFPALGINGEVMVALETRGGDLWVGGSFGAARIRGGDLKAQVFGQPDGLTAERILTLAEVGEDKVWAGSVDSLFELRGARWDRVKGGIERIHSIFRSREGAIWIGASDGVHQLNNGAWITHGDDEGLPSLLARDLAQDRRGRIWAASSRGAVEYFPESDTDEPRTLPPTIIADDLEENRGVTVRFSGVDKWNYTPAPRLLYAYRIDEGGWSAFTNVAAVSFTNLSAGPHYIQARAMDRSGNQDLSVATLEFAVRLPWSRDPRLIAVVALGIIAVGFFAGLAVNRHLRLKRSYAEVEQMVAERTAQLEKANQELLHSQKMRALGTLAAGIAHDFNNILSIIKGSAQIIENNPDDKDKVMTRVNRIQTVVDQGAGIVRSMLGLGKGGDSSECDSGELVEETIRLLGDRFPAEVQVRYDRNGAAPRLECSRGVIHQILLNLILNAVDASGGEGEIILRTRLVNEPGAGVALTPAAAPAYVAIDVIDKGIGIAPEVLPRIFEPFYTTKAFSSRRGTGLGLSMVYELAKGLGYGLAVNSVVGEGATFTVLAPVTGTPNS